MFRVQPSSGTLLGYGQRLAYRVLTMVALPFAMLRLMFKSLSYGKYLDRWWHRLGWGPRVSAPQTLWMHAVSVGEVINAMTLLDRLIATDPHVHYVVTTSTPTGMERLEALAPDHVTKAYFPYDSKGCVKRFINRIRPSFVVLIETEIWPHVLSVLQEHQINCLIVNARLSPSSFRGYARGMPWLASVMSSITWIGAQTRLDAKRFERLGASPVTVVGNLKCDRAKDPAWQVQADHVREQLGRHRPLWIAASTHPGEELICLRAMVALKKRHTNLGLVLVPRHPHRSDELEALCESHDLQVNRWSRGDMSHTSDVLLVDQLGLLPSLYGSADVAFVGGSLVEIGGHNPVEPALMGTPMMTGPQTFNFKLLFAQLRRAHGCEVVEDEKALEAVIHALLIDEARRQALSDQASKVMDKAAGALERYVHHIRAYWQAD